MNGILLPVTAELGVKISVSCHQINCKHFSIENTLISQAIEKQRAGRFGSQSIVCLASQVAQY